MATVEKPATETGEEHAIAELHEIVARQRAAFLADPFPSLEQRYELLGALTGMMIGHRSEIQEALSSDFGDHFNYTDTTELEFGIPSRSFTSFRNAAAETEHSRFYGGIHYEYSTIVSHKMGTEIGELVVQRLHMKK